MTSMSGADYLSRLSRIDRPDTFRVRTVIAVNTDGSVDLEYGPDEDGASVPITVPCLDGYHTRTVGDHVVVLQTDSVGWLVLGRPGGQPLQGLITPAPLPQPIVTPDFDISMPDEDLAGTDIDAETVPDPETPAEFPVPEEAPDA